VRLFAPRPPGAELALGGKQIPLPINSHRAKIESSVIPTRDSDELRTRSLRNNDRAGAVGSVIADSGGVLCIRWRLGLGDTKARGEGGGGGGGVRAVPVGVIEVSSQQTRFIPITDRRKLAGALLVGVGFGMWLGWQTSLVSMPGESWWRCQSDLRPS